MAYKHLFIDSDILLDVLLEREPFYRFGQIILSTNPKKQILISTSALVIANIYYILEKALGKTEAKEQVKTLLRVLNVLPLDSESIKLAISSNFNDIEDGMEHFIAMNNQCDVIITRNLKDYKRSLLPVMTSEQYLRTII